MFASAHGTHGCCCCNVPEIETKTQWPGQNHGDRSDPFNPSHLPSRIQPLSLPYHSTLNNTVFETGYFHPHLSSIGTSFYPIVPIVYFYPNLD